MRQEQQHIHRESSIHVGGDFGPSQRMFAVPPPARRRPPGPPCAPPRPSSDILDKPTLIPAPPIPQHPTSTKKGLPKRPGEADKLLVTVGFLYGAGAETLIFVTGTSGKNPKIFVSRQKNQSQLWIPRKPRKIGVWVSGAEIQTSAVDTRTAVWVSTPEKFSKIVLGKTRNFSRKFRVVSAPALYKNPAVIWWGKTQQFSGTSQPKIRSQGRERTNSTCPPLHVEDPHPEAESGEIWVLGSFLCLRMTQIH